MRGIVTGGIFIAILFAFETNGIDLKQYSDVELIEVKTTDENGNVKARVVARSVDSEGPGVDDEDSKSPDGSGARDTKGDQRDQYGDQPMNVVNNGTARESTRAIISPSPSISIDKDTTKETLQISSTTKVATKTRSLNSVESTSRETLQPSLKPSESIVIEPTSTVTSTQVSSLVSVTERPSLLTTEGTTEPKTTAGGPSTTSYDSPTTRLNVNKLTTESMSIIINGTKEPVVNTKSSVEIDTFFANKTTTTVKPTSKSTSESSLNVNAHRDPTEKPRNTLFGFVTVEILIALLAGALFSILLVAFLVYRLKKRNEGSYELSETIALRPKELDEMGTKKEVFV